MPRNSLLDYFYVVGNSERIYIWGIQPGMGLLSVLMSDAQVSWVIPDSVFELKGLQCSHQLQKWPCQENFLSPLSQTADGCLLPKNSSCRPLLLLVWPTFSYLSLLTSLLKGDSSAAIFSLDVFITFLQHYGLGCQTCPFPSVQHGCF